MKNILCYGASNTWGFIPGSFDLRTLGCERYAPEVRWPGVLANKLGKDFHVIEEGLNGRTTAFTDPIRGEFLNGKTYLYPCVLSHKPLDVVVIMLVTNDLKNYFNVEAGAIAAGLRQCIFTVRSVTNRAQTKMLVIAPPPIMMIDEDPWYGIFDQRSVEKSKKLAAEYELICHYEGCSFLHAGKIIQVSKADGIHFDDQGHRVLGEAVAEIIIPL